MAGQITTTAPNPDTKLSSNPAKGVAPADYNERGATSTQTSLQEYVAELGLGLSAQRTYEEMYRSDAQVRTTLRAAFTPVLSALPYLKPFSQETPDLLISEFVNWNLFQGMSHTFSECLHNFVKCLYLGAEVDELVWIQKPWVSAQKSANSKNMICLQKFGHRPMNTIQSFNYDENGGPAGVTHLKFNPKDPNAQPKEVDIPIEKLVIFTWDQQGGDKRGLSVLRSAYKHWYYKENFYKIDGVQKERHGSGVPLIKLPVGYDEDDLKFAGNLGRNLRTNERAYILQPPGWEISFAQLSGNMVDALDSAIHHDLMIARNVLVQFINAGGQSATGGSNRSTGAVMLDLFLSSSQFFATLLADTLNTYVIPQLVRYNFNVDRFPTLMFKGIGGEKDKQAEAAAFRNLAQAGLITATPETEKWMRDYFGIAFASDLDKVIAEKTKAAKQIENKTGVNPQPDSQQTGDQGTKPPTGTQPKGTTQG